MTTHQQSPEFPTYLSTYWPLYLMHELTAEQVVTESYIAPDEPAEMRRVFGAIFARTNASAAHGLTLTDDAELTYWGRILRGPLLRGEPGELTFMPAWLTVEGQLMAGAARLLTLPLFERLDVFLSAMHERGRP